MNRAVRIRKLTREDAAVWIPARLALWPDCAEDQHRLELGSIADDARQLALGAFDGTSLIGFAEFSLHTQAIGCGAGPIGFLEGWYVVPLRRRSGIGRQLVVMGEAWARSFGCVEMASDTWVGNTLSEAAHAALGFEAVDSLINFRKRL